MNLAGHMQLTLPHFLQIATFHLLLLLLYGDCRESYTLDLIAPIGAIFAQ